MINKKMRNEKGVSLVSLILSIIVLVILTNVIIYNISDSLKIENLEAMQNDIANLRDKVSTYYVQNGKIPANLRYTDVQNLRESGIISEAIDTGEFFVIDLSALEDVTLNYGRDFEKIKEDTQNVNQYKDVYIINEVSHNIFYVEGIKVDTNVFYTDYDADEIDTTAVAFRYVEGVKIPNEFNYVEGTKEEGIKIRSKEGTQEYRWMVQHDTMLEVPDDIEVDKKEQEDFIKSVNAYQGYYKSTNTSKVIYLAVENWSPVYDKEGVYQDKNGDTVYIPAGFQVSRVADENIVQKGLVIKNVETSNQYVWIQVPKNIFTTATSNTDYANIEQDMKNYAKVYIDDNCTDIWYNGCGIASESAYQELKNQMLASVYEKGGFWIGRYEAGVNQPKTNGLETETVDNIIATNGLPLSQRNSYPFHFVTCSQAQQLASKLGEGKEYHTSLMFGIQWDLVCKFIEGIKEKNELLQDSTNWANYKSATFEIIRGSYTSDPSLANLWKTADETGSYLKPNSSVLFTTGATNRNCALNLYDLAGNVAEWTLEKSESNMSINRGGHWESEEGSSGLAMRNYETGANKDIGFRVTLY